jgi:hypothetical protein
MFEEARSDAALRRVWTPMLQQATRSEEYARGCREVYERCRMTGGYVVRIGYDKMVTEGSERSQGEVMSLPITPASARLKSMESREVCWLFCC